MAVQYVSPMWCFHTFFPLLYFSKLKVPCIRSWYKSNIFLYHARTGFLYRYASTLWGLTNYLWPRYLSRWTSHIYGQFLNTQSNWDWVYMWWGIHHCRCYVTILFILVDILRVYLNHIPLLCCCACQIEPNKEGFIDGIGCALPDHDTKCWHTLGILPT